MDEMKINPYYKKIFGDWFKNMIILLLIIVLIIILFFGLKNDWLNQELGLQIAFLILGSLLGVWFSNGKK